MKNTCIFHNFIAAFVPLPADDCLHVNKGMCYERNSGCVEMLFVYEKQVKFPCLNSSSVLSVDPGIFACVNWEGVCVVDCLALFSSTLWLYTRSRWQSRLLISSRLYLVGSCLGCEKRMATEAIMPNLGQSVNTAVPLQFQPTFNATSTPQSPQPQKKKKE